MVQRIFHVNVNVTDMERSVAFHKKFGFRELIARHHHPSTTRTRWVIPSSVRGMCGEISGNAWPSSPR
jgi:hypothetical protein